jgi:4-amino-4-deoxy-L-arabinose transferase-like glycosyltransferase
MRAQPERPPGHARRLDHRRRSGPVPRVRENSPAHARPGATGEGAAPPWEADTTAPHGIQLDDHRPGQDPLRHIVREASHEERPGADQVDVPSGRLGRALASRGWPLLVVLAAQAALSARLVWSNTAFQDEGLYLWSGHLELAHLLHHAQIPEFASYFSGAPVIYPVIGALADAVGGLAGARLLSLAFILLATLLLHGMTRRLFSSRAAALFAAMLFAGTGSAQFLGGFATYDAMALMLLAVATWLGVVAAGRRFPARTALIVIGALALAAANATKYASALFDPVVIMVTALAVWRRSGKKAGLTAGLVMAVVTQGVLAAAYRGAGPWYAEGISFSTLRRASGTDATESIVLMSARWVGISALLGVAGAAVITHAWRHWPTTLLAWTLAGAVFLAPAEQARIHTDVSLFKHVGYGAWFAAAAGGYLLAALPRAAGRARSAGVSARRSAWWLRAAIAAAVLAGTVGVLIADAQYQGWPDSRGLTAALQRLGTPGGRYLIEDSNVPAYYLMRSVPWTRWSNTFYFGYTDPATGRYLQNTPAYADAIRHRYFAVIALAFGDTYPTDQVIVHDIGYYGGYRLADVIPYADASGEGAYKIWILAPEPKPPAGRSGHGARHTKA